MRDRLAVFASASAVLLVLALSPVTRAQQEKTRTEGAANANPTAGQNRTQTSSAKETIRGVIAGVTAEGEAMFDYRTNRAVAAEAAFLTVVGSPVKNEGTEATRTDEGFECGSRRCAKAHNVYIVWLTPSTKICEGQAHGGKAAAAGETRREDQKRELALDNLEVGDHVEIQFTKNDESGATNSAHQTDQMRKKHGRHRTHVGFATEVTILQDSDSHAAKSEGKRESRVEVTIAASGEVNVLRGRGAIAAPRQFCVLA